MVFGAVLGIAGGLIGKALEKKPKAAAPAAPPPQAQAGESAKDTIIAKLLDLLKGKMQLPPPVGAGNNLDMMS